MIVYDAEKRPILTGDRVRVIGRDSEEHEVSVVQTKSGRVLRCRRSGEILEGSEVWLVG